MLENLKLFIKHEIKNKINLEMFKTFRKPVKLSKHLSNENKNFENFSKMFLTHFFDSVYIPITVVMIL